MQQYDLQYVRVALGRERPSFFNLFLWRDQIYICSIHIRFDTAEIRRLNRCRISIGMREDQSNV